MAEEPEGEEPKEENAEEAASESSGVLDQSPADDLFSEAGEQEGQHLVYRPHGGIYGESEKVKIEVYDFRDPVFLTESELRQLKIRHEHFVSYLSARLSMFLRMDCQLELKELKTLPYSKCTELIANPSHINIFNIECLNGVGIVDITPKLGMAMVNRMLGGRGHSVQEERHLSEIEIGLIEEVVEIVLDEWCKQWVDHDDKLSYTILDRESDGRFLQTAPKDAIMMVFIVQVLFGNCKEDIHLAFPFDMINPLIEDLKSKGMHYQEDGELEKATQWMESYSDIMVPVGVEWGASELTLRDVLNLRQGDVLEMPQELLSNTEVRLRDTLSFSGKVGIENDYIVVKINKRVKEIV